MRFDPPLRQGVLVRRYKRFIADVVLADGSEITAHVANTGPMTGCAQPGFEVALSHHPNKGRKLPWSWEIVRPTTPWGDGESWALVNTIRANAVVGEALRARTVPAFAGYATVRPEVRWRPDKKSRLDFLLEDHEDGDPPCFVEVKNVTLREGGTALFPDTVTTRGARHVRDMTTLVREGRAKAAMFFLVARSDCSGFSPAAHLDPDYAQAVTEAVEAGVGIHAWQAEVSPRGMALTRELETKPWGDGPGPKRP